MKVRIALTVEVDEQAWADTYGCAPEDVRQDVQTYCAGQISGSAAAEECGLRVLRAV